MRYTEVLTEAILTNPRNLNLFLKNRKKDLDAGLAEMRTGSSLIEKHRDGESMLVRWLRYGSDYNDAADDLYRLTYWSERKIQTYEYLSDNIQSALTHGADFLRYIQSSLENIEPLEDVDRAVAALLPMAEKGAADYGFVPGDPDNEADEDYVAASGLLKGIRMALGGRLKADASVARLRSGMAAVFAKRAAYYSGRRYRPDHEEVETLYHATAFATEILRDGFHAEKPLDRQGLGNFGEQNTISFTHDLSIAHDIARTLKEVWMIVHGHLTARQIIGWIRAEKIDQRHPDLEKRIGISVEVPGEQEFFQPKRRLKKLTELSGPEETLRLFIFYLTLSQIHPNPVLVSTDRLIAVMKTRRLEDIAILACEVRLDPSIEYLEGESEFRVTADRVLSVKRLGTKPVTESVATKAVDQTGKPQVVYHGTNARFTTFDPAYWFSGSNDGDKDEIGFYFTTSQRMARRYGSRVIRAHLDVKNPYVVTAKQWGMGEGLSPKEAMEAGHDGYKITGHEGGTTWIVFRADQIKEV